LLKKYLNIIKRWAKKREEEKFLKKNPDNVCKSLVAYTLDPRRYNTIVGIMNNKLLFLYDTVPRNQ